MDVGGDCRVCSDQGPVRLLAAGAEGEDEAGPVRVGGPQPGPPRDEAPGSRTPRADDVPQVADRRRREHVVGRHGVPDALPTGGGEAAPAARRALVRGDEQPQLGQLGEEAAGHPAPDEVTWGSRRSVAATPGAWASTIRAAMPSNRR